MRFWDASALVPLYLAQARTTHFRRRLEEDADIAVWWGSRVECISAFCRLQREGTLDATGLTGAIRALHADSESWHEVLPTTAVRREAERLLRVHVLRAADSLQLAAGLEACDRDPGRLVFVCADTRLAAAAEKEGFDVLA
jgi:uncharacterized protein